MYILIGAVKRTLNWFDKHDLKIFNFIIVIGLIGCIFTPNYGTLNNVPSHKEVVV